jgi:hypothetical protein
LTTRIYAQIYTADYSKGTNIMYECAFVTMILVLLIILVVHVAIPAYYNYKRQKMRDEYERLNREEQKNKYIESLASTMLTPSDKMK